MAVLSRGSGAISVERVAGRSAIVRCQAESPLRLLSPDVTEASAWCFMSTFGGGLVDGDHVALDVDVCAEATLLVATQASTKVYRGSATQALSARVAGGGLLVLVPDPIVPFSGSRYAQRLEIELAQGASLALVDGFTAGRVAHGERWDFARYESRLRITSGGAPLLLDPLVLDPAHGALAPRMGRFEALATIVLLGPRLADASAAALSAVAATRVRSGGDVVTAASPIAGGALLRVGATDVRGLTAAVRAWLAPLDALVGEDPWRGRPLPASPARAILRRCALSDPPRRSRCASRSSRAATRTTLLRAPQTVRSPPMPGGSRGRTASPEIWCSPSPPSRAACACPATARCTRTTTCPSPG